MGQREERVEDAGRCRAEMQGDRRLVVLIDDEPRLVLPVQIVRPGRGSS